MSRAKSKNDKLSNSKQLSLNDAKKIAVEKRVVMLISNGNDYEKDVFIDYVVSKCGLDSVIPVTFTLEEDISYIASFINTRSLVYDGCVIIFQYSLKTLSKKTKYNKKTDTIGNILSKLIDTKYDKHLIIFEPDASDKRNTLQKKCSTDYCFYEFQVPTHKQLLKFIDNYCKNEYDNFSITPKACELLLSMILPDYYAVKSEIDKLAILYDNVDERIINDSVFPTSEVVVFDIIESLCKKQIVDAYRKTNNYINNGGNYFALISLLSRNFHYIYYARILKSKFSSITKQPSFLANKYIEYSKYYTERKLIHIMEAIVETQCLLKTGNNNENVIYSLIGRIV